MQIHYWKKRFKKEFLKYKQYIYTVVVEIIE